MTMDFAGQLRDVWKWYDGEPEHDNLTFLFSAVQKRLNHQDRDRKERLNIIYFQNSAITTFNTK